MDGKLFPDWRETFEGVDVPLVLLGDSAYPLLPWLMKPYPEGAAVTADQINFNFKLSQARMAVERAFGRLKGRWRCLLKECDAHITFVSRIVSACCVLHNYLEVHEEEYLNGEVEAEEGGDVMEGRCDYQQQSDIRNAFVQKVAADGESHVAQHSAVTEIQTRKENDGGLSFFLSFENLLLNCLLLFQLPGFGFPHLFQQPFAFRNILGEVVIPSCSLVFSFSRLGSRYFKFPTDSTRLTLD
ncbi:hypothetical protein WMY93_022145 [Mugilogobius chulae]|uniref:DDE Tnp4 domain-containing protein n=1 Tax=Mugilogobius chulae TaxID=88201 RepID=A0AAW0NE54_9GOBI